MPVRQKDAQRALELQQNPTKRAFTEEDCQLQQSLDRVINVFQSQLFSALLGKKICSPFIR
uniref:L27-1 domain-containing protein n=1 Tax=Stegastes partitus TaxID=144197 RepID=A0A3B5AL70_9TELE